MFSWGSISLNPGNDIHLKCAFKVPLHVDIYTLDHAIAFDEFHNIQSIILHYGKLFINVHENGVVVISCLEFSPK